jgi:anti-anti-sigma factor
VVAKLVADRSIRVVNLADVTFIDAAGLRALCEGIRRAPQRIIVGARSANVARFLAVAGIADIHEAAGAPGWATPA